MRRYHGTSPVFPVQCHSARPPLPWSCGDRTARRRRSDSESDVGSGVESSVPSVTERTRNGLDRLQRLWTEVPQQTGPKPKNGRPAQDKQLHLSTMMIRCYMFTHELCSNTFQFSRDPSTGWQRRRNGTANQYYDLC